MRPALTSCCFPLQTKKGVKRKADTTTPSAVFPTTPYDPPYEPSTSKPKALSGRRESIRQIKRPKKDIPGEELPQHSTKSKKEPLSEQMKYCAGIIKELFAKKHAVCITCVVPGVLILVRYCIFCLSSGLCLAIL